MINFILSYIIFLACKNKLNRPILFMLTEPLLVYSDKNRLISIFIFSLFLMEYVDKKHSSRKSEFNHIRRFGIMSSGFIRLLFFFYTIYSEESNSRNILYSIFLIILTYLDWKEYLCEKRSERIYDIIDYSSRIIFLFTFTKSIYFNLDIIAIPHILVISCIHSIESYS